MPSAVAVTTPIPTAASLPQAMAATANYGAVPVTPIGFLSELEKLLTAAADTTSSGMSSAASADQSKATPRWLPPAMKGKPPAASTDTPVTASAASAEPPADGAAQPSPQPPQFVAVTSTPAMPAAITPAPRAAIPGTGDRQTSPARRGTPKQADAAEATAIQPPAPPTTVAAPATMPVTADSPGPVPRVTPRTGLEPPQAAGTEHAAAVPPIVTKPQEAKPAAPFDAPSPSPDADTPVATSVAPPPAAADPTLSVLAPAPEPPTPRPEPADAATPASAPTAAHGASPAAQLAPALVQMGHAPDGATRLTVRLDPPELGHVEVRIERPPEAPARVEITVEKAETLTLLLRDQPQLQHALDQAGVPPEGRSVTFHVAPPDAAPRSEPTTAPAPGVAAGGPSNDGSHGAPRNGGQRRRQAGAPDGDVLELSAVAPPGWVRGGVDITA